MRDRDNRAKARPYYAREPRDGCDNASYRLRLHRSLMSCALACVLLAFASAEVSGQTTTREEPPTQDPGPDDVQESEQRFASSFYWSASEKENVFATILSITGSFGQSIVSSRTGWSTANRRRGVVWETC